MKSTENKMTAPMRPFCLELADAKSEIINAVNTCSSKHGIPMYLMEDILREAYRAVKDAADVERRDADADYKKRLDEYLTASNPDRNAKINKEGNNGDN